jgi:hypothetical protein
MIDKCEIARTVRAFLVDPASRAAFDDFFELSSRLARSYIALRVRRGTLHVPANEFPQATAIDDCACECLGSLFASKPSRPFHLIIDYFRSRITDQTPPDRIHALLQGMIAGHIDQELMRFNPQGVAIRRAILRAMGDNTFVEVRFGGRDHWALRSTTGSRREHLPAVDDSTLQHFIHTACRSFPDMPERCRSIFDQLNEDDRFQNLLECRRFISAMLRILTDHDDARPSAESGPRTEYVRRTVRLLAENAIELALDQVLGKQAHKRGFSEDESSAFQRALVNLMNDFTQDGDHDLLPGYFKEAMARCDESAYLQRYKYVWETLVSRCKELLRNMLREEGLAP